jgi:hypothetical protein
VQALFFMARVHTSVGTVRQLIDALSLALEKLIKHGGQQQYLLRAEDDQEEVDVCFIELQTPWPFGTSGPLCTVN